MKAAKTIIRTRNLTKRYGTKTAVDRLDLEVRSGQVYAFLGENGAGKTTTIRLLLGLQRPTEGDIQLFGLPLSGYRCELLHRVGSHIEFPSYYGHLSGRENLEVIRRLRSLPRSEVDRVLEVVGLSEAARTRVSAYSQGMKQRLAIAAALMGEPELVILDEPTNGLDPKGIREIRELVLRLPREMGTTVFVSSHLLSEVQQMATHVGILHRGRLLFQGSLEAVMRLARPQIRVSVTQPEAAVRVLSAHGVSADYTDSALLVAGDEAQIPAVSRLLTSAGIEVSGIIAQQPLLEDVYFALLQRQGERGSV